MSKNRIAELRKERGLTGDELAAQVGVSQGTISRWEAGLVTIPDRKKQELAEYFAVPVSYLMGWDKPNGNGDNDGVEVAA